MDSRVPKLLVACAICLSVIAVIVFVAQRILDS